MIVRLQNILNTERKIFESKMASYLGRHTTVRAGHPAGLAPRAEEESEAVRGVANVKRLAMGGVVHPSPPLNRLVGRHVDQYHSEVREEEEPYPNVVVSLTRYAYVRKVKSHMLDRTLHCGRRNWSTDERGGQ